mmetsp:Transcript_2415/g.2988  ORF Transcript_2415/g.2988 Transcript_2415/m.2988 type:complete len:274 (+) Transcript_2415:124-945(+)
MSTGRPIASMIDTSSVTSMFFALTFSKPSFRSSGFMHCGVCTSHSFERVSVFSTVPSALTCLIVGFTGTPKTAAPTFIPSAMQFRQSSMVTRGRAESWIATSCAASRQACSPLKTLSCRSAPGRANTKGFLLAAGNDAYASSKTCSHSSLHTTTSSPISCIWLKVSMLYVAMAWPESSRYCFGIAAPMRFPTPPARMMALTHPSGILIGASSSSPPARATRERPLRPQILGIASKDPTIAATFEREVMAAFLRIAPEALPNEGERGGALDAIR